ncbi:MAG TPA: translation elongation factor Ts [Spirochaetia bacterium]|nr:translation elongation factor Ts [Spirochaetales bacterium]HRW23324.1 translation elongation factor Ts [Spirochaetia bacterium]
MEIKATDIKNLREKTGAGMMDCKKALVEAEGDLALAERKLKEWGLAGVAKRAGRATNEGRVFIAESADAIAVVEIACETDFVCRNDDFIAGGDRMAKLALEKGYGSTNDELEAIVKDMASVIKENITLKSVTLVKAGAAEYVHSYVHGEGKLAVVVKMKSDKAEAFKNAEVAGFVHDLALHVAAFRPMFVDQSRIGADWIKEQQEIFQKQVEGDEKMAGKPAKVIEGILAGKLKKLMSEICLVDQGFVKDEKQTVAAVMASVAKAAGAQLSIVDYAYVKVGDNQ